MPDKIAGILKIVCRKPVTNPAAAPARTAQSIASAGLMPVLIRTTVTAAPSGKVPSTVRSAMSRILNVKYTPSVRIAHMRPWAMPLRIVAVVIISKPPKAAADA